MAREYTIIPKQFMPPTDQSIISLDESMKRILDRRDIDDEEKLLLYIEAFHKYMTFTRKRKYENPGPKMVPEIPKNIGLEPPAVKTKLESPMEKIKNEVVESAPVRSQKKAQSILEHLKNFPDLITTNENKELIYKGTVIPGSNMSDLVWDILTQTRKNPPSGIKEFTEILAETNIPEHFITNSFRKNALRSYKIGEREIAVDTPKRKKKKKAKSQKGGIFIPRKWESYKVT